MYRELMISSRLMRHALMLNCPAREYLLLGPHMTLDSYYYGSHSFAGAAQPPSGGKKTRANRDLAELSNSRAATLI